MAIAGIVLGWIAMATLFLAVLMGMRIWQEDRNNHSTPERSANQWQGREKGRAGKRPFRCGWVSRWGWSRPRGRPKGGSRAGDAGGGRAFGLSHPPAGAGRGAARHQS